MENTLKEKFTLSLPFVIEVDENKNQIAPGQFKKHYSSFLNSFLLSSKQSNVNKMDRTKKNILIDFNQNFKSLKNDFHGYFDLSPRGSIKQAIKNFYLLLRKAERIKGAEQIFIANLEEFKFAS